MNAGQPGGRGSTVHGKRLENRAHRAVTPPTNRVLRAAGTCKQDGAWWTVCVV